MSWSVVKLTALYCRSNLLGDNKKATPFGVAQMFEFSLVIENYILIF